MKQIKPSPHRRFTPACGISPRHYTPKRTFFYPPAEPEQNFTIEVLMEENVVDIQTSYNFSWCDWNHKLPETLHMNLKTTKQSPSSWAMLLSGSLHNSGYYPDIKLLKPDNNPRHTIIRFSVFKPAKPARYIKQNKAP